MLKIYGPGGHGETTDLALDIVLSTMMEDAVYFEAFTNIGPCSDVNVFCDCLQCEGKARTTIYWQSPLDQFLQVAYVTISK